MIEAARFRREAFEIFFVPGCGKRRQRPAMKRAAERDDPLPLRMTGDIMIAPRNLDRAFARLRARIAEEDALGERQPRQLFRNGFLAFDAIKVRRVPELVRLRLERRDESRMRVTERVDRDA